MSRNPYLAASRPSSSYTRSSRSSSRTGGAGGGLLGRSRSSATLGGLSSQSTAYSSSSLYVPQWQRSTSSTRAGSSAAQQVSSYKPASDDWQSSRSTTRAAASTGLAKSTSSHSLGAQHGSLERDDHDSSSSHLKNYQDSRLQQQSQQPSPTPRPTIARANRSSSMGSSLESDGASQSEATRKSSASLADSAGSSVDLDESIGDNIPSASARHLRSSQLSKSKSLELSSSGNKTDGSTTNDSPLLHGSMSVDRLLLRADSMGERDLRKSFKELVMENERLKQQLKGFDDKDKLRQQDWIRKERQMHRKISELEEENKQLEQWKQEIQRLKDENNSLIRVVSKLTKQHH